MAGSGGDANPAAAELVAVSTVLPNHNDAHVGVIPQGPKQRGPARALTQPLPERQAGRARDDHGDLDVALGHFFDPSVKALSSTALSAPNDAQRSRELRFAPIPDDVPSFCIIADGQVDRDKFPGVDRQCVLHRVERLLVALGPPSYGSATLGWRPVRLP